MGSKVNIRIANVDDAEAIIAIHYAAVHETAAGDYAPEILDDWSSSEELRVNALKKQIEHNPENTHMLVAEVNGAVLGFGELAPETNEIRAVYVSPQAGRKGAGKALLQRLEDIAIKQGLTKLWLDSSLTAEAFYKKNGYSEEERGKHLLRSGRKMSCIKMLKHL